MSNEENENRERADEMVKKQEVRLSVTRFTELKKIIFRKDILKKNTKSFNYWNKIY